ncbi:MAG: hypothetical protein AABX23_00290 [Nanoarchaeota archaeon]
MSLPKILAIIDYQGIQKRFEETRIRLQKKISRFSEELVVAVSRDYEGQRFTSHGPIDIYSVENRLEVGKITERTVFRDLAEPSNQNFLISGLECAFYLTDGKFIRLEPAQFQGVGFKGLLLLADMDEPPEAPIIDWEEYQKLGEFPIIGPQGSKIEETRDSRLELYIGNSMAVPYLRGSKFAEGELEHLSKELGIKLD